MTKPVLNQINIVSANMRETIDFYRLLGVQIPDPPPSKSGEPFHVTGHSGAMRFDVDSEVFARVWNEGWRGHGHINGRVVVGFHVETRDSVDEQYEKLTQAGYKGLQPPWDAFWGARYAVVEDPNGIAVGLMSPRDPAKSYWPPEHWEA